MKNTALYNKVLEAMDKGQIVVFKNEHGYEIPSLTWSTSGSSFVIKKGLGNIYYEDGATNLYVPTTLTASSSEPV